MNDLYKNEWRLYQNFFMPLMKLTEKTRIGARYRKKYDSPQTPYQRVLQEPSIAQEQKGNLTMTYKTLDPFFLKKSIKIKLNRILKFAGLR